MNAISLLMHTVEMPSREIVQTYTATSLQDSARKAVISSMGDLGRKLDSSEGSVP